MENAFLAYRDSVSFRYIDITVPTAVSDAMHYEKLYCKKNTGRTHHDKQHRLDLTYIHVCILLKRSGGRQPRAYTCDSFICNAKAKFGVYS